MDLRGIGIDVSVDGNTHPLGNASCTAFEQSNPFGHVAAFALVSNDDTLDASIIVSVAGRGGLGRAGGDRKCHGCGDDCEDIFHGKTPVVELRQEAGKWVLAYPVRKHDTVLLQPEKSGSGKDQKQGLAGQSNVEMDSTTPPIHHHLQRGG